MSWPQNPQCLAGDASWRAVSDKSFDILLCPSDMGAEIYWNGTAAGNWARGNYACNAGGIHQPNAPPNGTSATGWLKRNATRMWRRVMPLSRACGLMKEESEIAGWSIRRWPTPGNAARTSMPRSRRWPAGPMRVGPVFRDEASMPPQQGVGLHQEDGPAVTANDAGERGEDGAVVGCEPRTCDLTV